MLPGRSRTVWYAALVTLVAFLALYFTPVRIPWLAAVTVSVGLAGIGFGLYRLCHDWRPVTLFAVGIGLSFAPIEILSQLPERFPTIGGVALVLLTVVAPVLTLIGILWCLYAGFRSRRVP